MNSPICGIHGKSMKSGKFGYFCPTPIEKKGDVVTKWCDFKAEDLVPTMQESTEKINEVLSGTTPPASLISTKTETYRIQKQHSQHMSLLFLDYCARMNLDPAKEIENVERWTKIFQEALEI